MPDERLRERDAAPAGGLLRLRDLVVVELAARAQHLRERGRTADEGRGLLVYLDGGSGRAGDRLVRLKIDGL